MKLKDILQELNYLEDDINNLTLQLKHYIDAQDFENIEMVNHQLKNKVKAKEMYEDREVFFQEPKRNIRK